MKRTLALAALALCLSGAARAGEERIALRSDVHVNRGETVDSAASVFGSVFVDGDVVHSAISVFGDVSLGPTGHVGGDAVSLGGSVARADGSTLKGKIPNGVRAGRRRH